jgi:predicted CopG family antitoxin
MAHQITITVSDEVYRGLQTVVGSRTISEFFEELARPIVTETCLESAYREMLLDSEREREAAEWIDGLVGDSAAGDRDAAR